MSIVQTTGVAQHKCCERNLFLRWRRFAVRCLRSTHPRQSVPNAVTEAAEDTWRSITRDLPTADSFLPLTYSPTAFALGVGRVVSGGLKKNAHCFTTSELRPSFSALAYSTFFPSYSLVSSIPGFLKRKERWKECIALYLMLCIPIFFAGTKPRDLILSPPIEPKNCAVTVTRSLV
jgi:hypothetical protein